MGRLLFYTRQISAGGPGLRKKTEHPTKSASFCLPLSSRKVLTPDPSTTGPLLFSPEHGYRTCCWKESRKKRKFTLVPNWQHWHGACHRERSGGQGPELSWDGQTKWTGAQMSPDKPSQKECIIMFGKWGSHPWDCPPVRQSSKNGGADSCNCAQQNSDLTGMN